MYISNQICCNDLRHHEGVLAKPAPQTDYFLKDVKPLQAF